MSVRRSPRVSPGPLSFGLLTGVMTCAWLAGCGPAPTPPAADAAKPTKKPAASTTEEPSTAPGGMRTDAEGRKWVGDIPYDVFFDDPLAVVANSTTVGPAPMNGTPTPAETPAPTPEPMPTDPAPAAPTGSSAGDWKSIISMEQITEETKRIRQQLTAALQSVSTYNGNVDNLKMNGSVVAALASIAPLHTEDVTWKKNAHILRAYGEQLFASAEGLGKEPYTRSQNAAEAIDAVLSGNVPGDAGDPPVTKPYGEAINRRGVMFRMRDAADWMKSNVDTEAVFEKEQERIRLEAAVLAALVKIIADPSYESAEEEDYAKPARDVLEAAVEVQAAVEEKAFPKFQGAMNKIKKACDACHQNYGTGG